MFELILTHHRNSSTSELHLHIAVSDSFLLHNQITLIFIHSAKSQSFGFHTLSLHLRAFPCPQHPNTIANVNPLPYLLFEITIIDYFIHHKSQTTKMNSGDGSVLSLRSFSDILILHLNKGVSPWVCLITTELKLEHVAWFTLSYKTPHPETSFAYCSHHRFRLSNVTHLPTTTRHNLNLLDSAILH